MEASGAGTYLLRVDVARGSCCDHGSIPREPLPSTHFRPDSGRVLHVGAGSLDPTSWDHSHYPGPLVFLGARGTSAVEPLCRYAQEYVQLEPVDAWDPSLLWRVF